MKSPEKNIDEVLQKALQRRFEDFQGQPDESLKGSIFKKLKALQSPGIIQQMLVTILLLAIVVTGSFMFFSTEELQENNVLKSQKVLLNSKKKADILKGNGSKSRKEVLSYRQKLAAPLKGNVKSLSIIDQEKDKSAFDSKAIFRDKKANTIESSSIHDKKSLVNISDKNAGNAILIKKINKDNLDRKSAFQSVTDQNNNQPESFSKTKDDTHTDGFNSGKNLMTNNTNEHILNRILTLLDKKQFLLIDQKTFLKAQIKLVKDTTPFLLYSDRKQKWALVVGAIPMNTFQQLTIMPNPDITYQNFKFPSQISIKSFGYKFNVGAQVNGFQFLLNYSRFKQSFKYEIATDEYLVDTGNPNDFKTVRVGIPVEEENTIKLLGIGIKKHALIRSCALQNYFGDIGMEYAREFTGGKNMLWGNAGIGKEMAISKSAFLAIGPYVEYSFTKLLNSKNKFQVQPYQIGLSVGLKYRRK